MQNNNNNIPGIQSVCDYAFSALSPDTLSDGLALHGFISADVHIKNFKTQVGYSTSSEALSYDPYLFVCPGVGVGQLGVSTIIGYLTHEPNFELPFWCEFLNVSLNSLLFEYHYEQGYLLVSANLGTIPFAFPFPGSLFNVTLCAKLSIQEVKVCILGSIENKDQPYVTVKYCNNNEWKPKRKDKPNDIPADYEPEFPVSIIIPDSNKIDVNEMMKRVSEVVNASVSAGYSLPAILSKLVKIKPDLIVISGALFNAGVATSLLEVVQKLFDLKPFSMGLPTFLSEIIQGVEVSTNEIISEEELASVLAAGYFSLKEMTTALFYASVVIKSIFSMTKEQLEKFGVEIGDKVINSTPKQFKISANKLFSEQSYDQYLKSDEPLYSSDLELNIKNALNMDVNEGLSEGAANSAKEVTAEEMSSGILSDELAGDTAETLGFEAVEVITGGLEEGLGDVIGETALELLPLLLL
ncbi:hypothetical protein N9E78_00580 [bacterium]|nr:hypothetical protein [bacterium]